MTDKIQDQPAPIATIRKPAWDLVIAYAETVYPMEEPVAKLVVDDMRERDRVGRERYGLPLTAKNGRDHLVDAYQEQLDLVVYLQAWLDERDISIEQLTEPPEDLMVQSIVVMFVQQMSMLPMLRSLIEAAKTPEDPTIPL